MPKYVTSLLLFLLGFYNCLSQSDSVNIYKIQYERILSPENVATPLLGTYELMKFVGLQKSIYYKKGKINEVDSLVNSKDDDSMFYFEPSGANIGTVFKNYEKNLLYSKHEVAYKYFVIEDNLDIFRWKISDSTKQILGFNCQLATMDFRGRSYEAWFSTELPRGGPWKYDGLPGMILELKTNDDFIAFKAIGINKSRHNLTVLDNPFNTKKTLNWDQFTRLYKKKAIELLAFRPNDKTNGVRSSRGGIEFYIPENDKEYNEALSGFYKRGN